MSTVRHHIGNTFKQNFLGIFIKINDDIPTKNDVERPFHRPVFQQIQALEVHHVAQLVLNLNGPPVFIDAEIFLQYIFGEY